MLPSPVAVDVLSGTLRLVVVLSLFTCSAPVFFTLPQCCVAVEAQAAAVAAEGAAEVESCAAVFGAVIRKSYETET
jgi:hypothetical protein